MNRSRSRLNWLHNTDQEGENEVLPQVYACIIRYRTWWTSVCCSRSRVVAKSLLQVRQWWLRSSGCLVRLCTVKLQAAPNSSPHRLHRRDSAAAKSYTDAAAFSLLPSSAAASSSSRGRLAAGARLSPASSVTSYWSSNASSALTLSIMETATLEFSPSENSVKIWF